MEGASPRDYARAPHHLHNALISRRERFRRHLLKNIFLTNDDERKMMLRSGVSRKARVESFPTHQRRRRTRGRCFVVVVVFIVISVLLSVLLVPGEQECFLCVPWESCSFYFLCWCCGGINFSPVLLLLLLFLFIYIRGFGTKTATTTTKLPTTTKTCPTSSPTHWQRQREKDPTSSSRSLPRSLRN